MSSLPESNDKLVLITGVNGYIASWTAKIFLDAGYHVRGTSRSTTSGQTLTEGPLKAYADAGRFSMVAVPDITADGAFDEAVQGCHAIAHMASPVSQFFTDPEPVLRTATEGTLQILRSAQSHGASTLKSFVLASSIAAIMSPKDAPYTFSEKDWNDFSGQEVARLGKEVPGPQIYRASKAAAERSMWNFRSEQKPSFSMTAINPVWVQGPPLVLPQDPEKLNETVLSVWKILSGQEWKVGWLGGSGSTCDVRDVGRVTLFGVQEPEKADGQRYIICSGLGSEQAVADMLRAKYTDRNDIIKPGTPGAGYLPGYGFPADGISIDMSKAVHATGQNWIEYEKTILDSAAAFESYL